MALQLHWTADGQDPWPLRLPWHLTRHGGEPLADLGWTFTLVPTGITPLTAPAIDLEHLCLCGDRCPDAAADTFARDHHLADLHGLVQRHWPGAILPSPCRGLDSLPAALAGPPAVEWLYLYTLADGLDTDTLAAILAGSQVRLLVLNLLADRAPDLPAALVQGRTVLCAVHPPGAPEQARAAGRAWLTAMLNARTGQDLAALAWGPSGRGSRSGPVASA